MRPPLLSTLHLPSALAPRWRILLGLALVPVLGAAVLVGAAILAASTSPPPPTGAPAGGAAAAGPGAAAPLPAPSGILVEVTGAVVHPGIYRVASGERVAAAIAAAGGITAGADPNRLPAMAARLKDGQQVRVPFLGTPARSSTSAAGTGSPRVARVSLNTATREQLAGVPGFTPELAAAVITYRTEFGGFASTRELLDVLAMSQADYVLARRYVTT